MKSSTYDLTGKIALVTGASGGLGQSFAADLAESGAMVVLAGRRPGPLKEVARSIADQGGRAYYRH